MSALTRETIEQASGIDLSGLVAEHVFGWRWWADIKRGQPLCALFHPKYPPNKKFWQDVTDTERPARFSDWHRAADVPLGLCCQLGVPPYSTDHNAMALVLERMNSFGYTDIVGRTAAVPTPIVARLFAPIRPDAPKWTLAECHSASAATRPEAVAKAALLAIAAQQEAGE